MNKPKEYFPKVREAREALLAYAEELIELKKKIILEAIAAGEYETADNAVNFLLSHMHAHEGKTVLSTDIDKNKGESGPKGPVINIGFALGGVPQTKGLPIEVTALSLPEAEPIIEVDVEKLENE